MNPYEAWYYLVNHPAFEHPEYGPEFSTFPRDLDIDFVKVNPSTNIIDDDDSLNTKTEVWLEFGPPWFDEESGKWYSSHDIELDCGGDTFEEAIIELARLVKKHYGDEKPKEI
jgi:hypothetical protein